MVAGMKALQAAAIQLCTRKVIHNLLKQNASHRVLAAGSESRLFWLQCPSIMLIRGMAGHSKWQNIKSTKEKNDALKATQFNFHCLRIRKAALNGAGGANPKVNTDLAKAIAEARKVSMPNSTIESVLKKLMNPKLKPGEIELVGPGGCLLLLEVETENLPRTVGDVRFLLRKTKLGMFSKDSRCKTQFEVKGIARVSGKKDGSKVDLEAATEDGVLLADAEDVQELNDVEGNPILMFVSSKQGFGKMMRWLNESDYVVEDSGLEYVARNPIELPDEVMELALELCNHLEEMSDVVKVNVNIR